MGHQERHEIIGRTVEEHAEAQRSLAALEAKAQSYAKSMRIVAHELAPGRFATVDSLGDSLALEKLPSKDDVIALLEEMKVTKDRVGELGALLRKMGV